MEQLVTFEAPWGTSLKIMTGISLVILLGIPAIGLTTGLRGGWVYVFSMVVLPLVILGIAFCFQVRGYVLADDTLLVERLGWQSRIELAGLESVEHDPEAMNSSVRAFGNGGMFSISGTFHNQKLGSYRVYATDRRRAVVLRFADRVVVVTPGDPDDLVARIRAAKGLAPG